MLVQLGDESLAIQKKNKVILLQRLVIGPIDIEKQSSSNL